MLIHLIGFIVSFIILGMSVLIFTEFAEFNKSENIETTWQTELADFTCVATLFGLTMWFGMSLIVDVIRWAIGL